MSTGPAPDLSQRIQQDGLWRLMWKLSIPGLLGMSVNAINNFMDALFVGRMIGEDAFAAISLAFPIMFVVSSFTAMTGQGSSSLLSRAIGAKDLVQQEKIYSNLVALNLMITSLLMLAGWIFARKLIAFMGGQGQVLEYGTQYFRIIVLGSFFRSYAIGTNMLIRAEGNMKHAMLFAALAAGLNICLNPLFIGPLGLGIKGAGWATVVSMVFYGLLNLWYFTKGKVSFPIKPFVLSLDKPIIKEVMSVGVSAMALQAMFFVQQAVVFKSVAHYGNDTEIALMGAVYRIFLLLVIPLVGMMQALQAVVGINYGAKLYGRVKKALGVFTFSSTLLLTCVWLFMELWPRLILGLLLPKVAFDAHQIFLFRVAIAAIPLTALLFAGISFFQALGDGLKATVLLVSRQVGLFVPVTLLLPLWWGLEGIFYAAPLVDFFVAFVLVYVLWRQIVKLTRAEGKNK